MNLLKTIVTLSCLSLPILSANNLYAQQSHHAHDHLHHEHAKPIAHLHGVAKMQISIVNKSILIEVQSPLFNVFGFEHYANNKQQKAVITQQLATIETGDLIALTAKAKCQLVSKHILQPFADKDSHHSHEHNHHKNETEHRDLSFEYQFECQKLNLLTQVDTAPLFTAWPNLTTLQVEWLVGSRQSASKLDPNTTVLTFE